MDDVPQKVCKKCGELEPRTGFHANAGTRDGRRPDGKVCNLAAQKARRQANPELNAHGRARGSSRIPSATASTRSRTRPQGDGRSSIVRATSSASTASLSSGTTRCSNSKDHCHDTGEVRGLLCFSCNNGLGDFHHNPDLLQIAIDYLTAEPE
jgi:hypothetical protein